MSKKNMSKEFLINKIESYRGLNMLEGSINSAKEFAISCILKNEIPIPYVGHRLFDMIPSSPYYEMRFEWEAPKKGLFLTFDSNGGASWCYYVYLLPLERDTSKGYFRNVLEDESIKYIKALTNQLKTPLEQNQTNNF